MMMPFSTEKESTGSPSMLHFLIFTGSPRVAETEKEGEQGMAFSVQSPCHSLTQSVRKSTVKAPK